MIGAQPPGKMVYCAPLHSSHATPGLRRELASVASAFVHFAGNELSKL